MPIDGFEFARQPSIHAFACFFWPEYPRWQAVVCHTQHLKLAEDARQLALKGRQLSGASNPTEQMLAGDCLNALAEMVLHQMDDPQRMGALLAYATDVLKDRFLFVTVRRDDRGTWSDVTVMNGVDSVERARAWVDRHPEIALAKMRLLADVAKGPQH